MSALAKSELATIDGRQVEYQVSGSGRPPIVLLNGAGGPVEGWYKIHAELSQLATVLAYNRAGIGKSSAPRDAQTGNTVTEELRALLKHIRLTPPYVLVGHSLGGLHANLFARLYPNEVAGVLFLDATAPGDEILQDQHTTALHRLTKFVVTMFFSPYRDALGETNQVAETVAQIGRAGPFPPIPVVVLSGGKVPSNWLMSDAARAIRAGNQVRLSRLSPQGKRVIATKSGHFPQFDAPQLVVQCILELIEHQRSGDCGIDAQIPLAAKPPP